MRREAPRGPAFQRVLPPEKRCGQDWPPGLAAPPSAEIQCLIYFPKDGAYWYLKIFPVEETAQTASRPPVATATILFGMSGSNSRPFVELWTCELYA